MIEDVRTILWKELKEFLSQGGRGRMARATTAIAFLPGLLIPLQFGRHWVDSPIALLTLTLTPFIVLTVIADSVAGERERHTLETLLASRLSDRAILYGKIGAATLYVCAHLLMFMLPSLLIVNLFMVRDRLVVYPLAVWIGVFLVGPLLAILASTIGVLISMRARTVRQAQMTLMTIMFLALLIVPLLLAAVVILVVMGVSIVASGSTLDNLQEFGRNSGLLVGVLAALAVLLALNVAVLGVAERRFRRPSLILD